MVCYSIITGISYSEMCSGGMQADLFGNILCEKIYVQIPIQTAPELGRASQCTAERHLAVHRVKADQRLCVLQLGAFVEEE